MDFSNSISETTDEQDELSFISARAAMKADGRFEFVFTAAVLNEEKGCITLIDNNTATACTVWIKPYEDSQFEVNPEQTDGARLGRAIARAYPAASNEEIFASASLSGGTLIVEKNPKYNNAWLWTIKI